ncbi:hypothetical protein DPMN_185729 [Dreissena polymorpha]|uniref:Uncharacterized protein n=1 Tax=Dreissena polymorpha TaxID=45954 RepID=A0A9D4I7J5_DREPO|nr:hypothetical protein DPMN_185729 [Dreissena polymorpha]
MKQAKIMTWKIHSVEILWDTIYYKKYYIGDSGKSKGDNSCSPNMSGKMSTVGVP